jgi:hypothetical protein
VASKLGRILLAGMAGWAMCGGLAQAASTAAYKGTADDFVEINQLFAKYDFAIDNGDGEGWADTFTPDGVFRDPSWCAIGREKLIGVVGRKPQVGKDLGHHHVPAIGPIEYADRNTAHVHSTVMVVSETGAGKPGGGIQVTGSYDDTIVRLNGKWLFKYRLVKRPSATPAVPCAAQPPWVATIKR